MVGRSGMKPVERLALALVVCALVVGLTFLCALVSGAEAQGGIERLPAVGLGFFHGEAIARVPLTDTQLSIVQMEYTWGQLDGGPVVVDGMVVARKLNVGTLDAAITQVRAAGKGYVLRVPIYQNRSVDNPGLPADMRPLTFRHPQGWLIPRFDSSELLRNYKLFLGALAARYGSDPALVMVQVPAGLYGETHPDRNDSQCACASWLYEPAPELGKRHRLEPCEWIAWVKDVMAAYDETFGAYGVPLVIMNATQYGFPCLETEPPYSRRNERVEIQQAAVGLGIGFQNNSLDEWDANWLTCAVTGTTGTYVVDGSVQAMLDYSDTVPVAFERGSWLAPYDKFLRPAYFQTWWSYLNGLDKGADLIFPPNWEGAVLQAGVTYSYTAGVFGYPAQFPYAGELHWMNSFAAEHLGPDPASAWVAMFSAPASGSYPWGTVDTYWYCTAEHDDYKQKASVQGPNPWPPVYYVEPVVPPFYSGKYARRSAQAAGIDSLPFDVDDFWAAGRMGWEVAVWYLDDGADHLTLEYNTVVGPAAYLLAKTDTRQWVRRVVELPLAVMDNGVQGADLVLRTGNDGPDEYLHMVEFRPMVVQPTSTPTATASPTNTASPTPTATASPTMTPSPTSTPRPPFDFHVEIVPGDRRLTIIITW